MDSATDIGSFRFDVLTDEYVYVRNSPLSLGVRDREADKLVITQGPDWNISQLAVAGEYLFVGSGRGEFTAYGPSSA